MSIRERWRRHRAETQPVLSVSPSTDDFDLDADIIPEQVYHDAALAFLSAQIRSSEGLDGKASQALTVGSAALPLTIALVNVARASGSDAAVVSLDGVPLVLFIVALVFYLAILLLNFRIGFVGVMQFEPAMDELRRNYRAQRRQPLAGRGLKDWVADAYIESAEANALLLKRKIRLISLTQSALALEGAALALGAAWALLS